MSDAIKRFALIGAGFWSQYHLAAWREVGGVECVAICDRDLAKAEHLAAQIRCSRVCTDAEHLLANERLDFVDIVTDVDSHVPLARLAIQANVPVICQKPLATSMAAARELCYEAQCAGIPLLVHENWRWQAPLRRLKQILATGKLGRIVRARIDYANSFPVFDNQPALKQLKQFILTDIGTHILDVSRFLFGEATELYCQTRRMRHDIAGEDVATVMMRKVSGATVTCNMSYASHWELDRFPQTMVAVEGTKGGVSLQTDYRIVTVDQSGQQQCEQIELPCYSWCDPAYALIHSSMVACQSDLLKGLSGRGAETTGSDNLRTLELVFGAYESADQHRVLSLAHPSDA